MKVFYDKDCDLSLVKGKTVAIIGYGSQGHAHAQNLHESGVKVVVGLRKGGASWNKAANAGLEVKEVADAVKSADIVMMLLPDEHIAAVYNEFVAPNIKKGGALAFVRVKFAPKGVDAPYANVDSPGQYPEAGTPPAAFAHAPGLAEITPDIDLVKRQWGAFHGTELDTLLRRRGVDTIILTGIATNFGVESTAREAWSRYYGVIIAEDAVSGLNDGMHDFAVKNIFPRISRVRSTAEILANA